MWRWLCVDHGVAARNCLWLVWGPATALSGHCCARTTTAHRRPDSVVPAWSAWCSWVMSWGRRWPNKDGMCFGREGSALFRETLAILTLSCCWQYSPIVVIRALGGGDWWSHGFTLWFWARWFTSLHFSPAGSVIPIWAISRHSTLQGWESCSHGVCAVPMSMSVRVAAGETNCHH